MTSARTDYAGHRMDLRESRIRKLLRLLEDETPGRLLDVGCAGGELAALLATRGWRVQGAEAEPALVEAARARGVEARSVDLDRAPLPWPAGAFDAVVAAEVLEHVVDTDHLLAEIARVLRPGGALVSTLVLNWNGAHLLDDCLVTLAAQDWPAHEVVVVDNGSGDDSAAVTARHPARWLPMGDNLGFTRAYNRAVRDAKGELLFFVNNDMRFEPDCVGRLARALAADDTLFAVDPTQRSWDGARVIHGRTRFVPGSYHDVVVPPWAVEYTAAAAGPVEVPWGCAGSLLVRRDRFEALDGFDPTFFIDFEDTDLCWRAWRRGWRTIHLPDAVLYHKVGMSGDEYQHLIRGVAPGQVPKTWFRRRVSYHTNLLRFGLKVLPARDAARLAAALLARAAWHVSRRNLKLALSIALAFIHNARRLPDTLAVRRRVRDGARPDHAAAVRRFSAP